jgi:phosphoenolpyruvate phosphomutase
MPPLLVGTHNALAARIAEEAGFDGCWISSLEISTAKGIPDRNLLGVREMIEAAQVVRTVTDIPIVVDCDNGYGTDLATARAAKELSMIGVAGMCIEDNAFPKQNSLIGGFQRSLEDRDAFAARITQARKVADLNFVIIARTEALVAGLTLPEAMDRARAYAQAGADLVVIHSTDRDERTLWKIANSWDGSCPLAAIPTTYSDVTLDDLAGAGYRLIVYANQLLRAALLSMSQVAKKLRQGDRLSSVESKIAPIEEILRLSGEQGFIKRKTYLCFLAIWRPRGEATYNL